MVRGRRHALARLERDLLHPPLTPGEPVDYLGPTSTCERGRHGCKCVEERDLRIYFAHSFKLSFEYLSVKRDGRLRLEGERNRLVERHRSAYLPSLSERGFRWE